MEKLIFLKGKPHRQGAEVCAEGVNFSIFSRNAYSVTLHLFKNAEDIVPFSTYTLSPSKNKTGDIWHVFVKGLEKGALYLYTVDGPVSEQEGYRFSPNSYLLDPYAKQLTDSSISKSEQTRLFLENFGKNCTAEIKTAKGFPKCVVVDDTEFDWEDDEPINLPMRECIIYEAHLKGFSFLNSSIDQSKRGTYIGLTTLIPYLKNLGITAVELLPIHEFDEYENFHLNPKNGEFLKNYWGYSTLSFFAPKASYAAVPENAVNEFKFMVREFHKAGIEILLDVVFNHTAEGNELGPVFSFKGIDNSIYYHLKDNKSLYQNYSGCGNSINASHPVVIKFIIDCLCYWVTEMHIDGFRFDLAPVLARTKEGSVDVNSYILNAIAEEPVLRNSKIIAEAWDAEGAYLVGALPGRWAEWNDVYRDEVRKFWLLPESNISRLAARLTGSSDLYSQNGKKPYQSVNFVTCHDGFTLKDLLSYSKKHNEQNGEDNRDGSNNNFSFNHGAEGKASLEIENARYRTAKNILLTLFLSSGTPMLNMGDEVFRTQHGNNNAYCQDNYISWFDWELVEANKPLLEFTKKLIQFRKKHTAFMRDEFFTGLKKIENTSYYDIMWFNSSAQEPDWNSQTKFLAFLLNGNTGNPIYDKPDNDFYIILNGHSNDLTVTIPPSPNGKIWRRLIDTSYIDGKEFAGEETAEPLSNQNMYVVLANTAVVLIG